MQRCPEKKHNRIPKVSCIRCCRKHVSVYLSSQEIESMPEGDALEESYRSGTLFYCAWFGEEGKRGVREFLWN